MNIDLLVVGKTDSAEIQSLVATYLKRLNFYTRVTLVTLPDLKNTRNLSAESQKRQEGELLMRQFADGDYVVLLDEKGAEMRSVEFSMWLQKRMNSGVRRLCFVIGGPYGFSKTVYDRADESISLSRMTFSHQIIDGDSGSVRTACRFRPGLFLRGYVHLAEIDRHFAELPDKIHAEYAVPALSRTGRAVFGCFHNHVVDSDLRTARP